MINDLFSFIWYVVLCILQSSVEEIRGFICDIRCSYKNKQEISVCMKTM